ncbi:hypothetical protein QJQ45_025608 [Haematococcus lacustris]|nr:hypothetical protein QJQ45_025608 [Haematococcus lacustris]
MQSLLAGHCQAPCNPASRVAPGTQHTACLAGRRTCQAQASPRASVVLTREQGKNDKMLEALTRHGLHCIELPLIQHQDGPDRATLPALLREGQHDWVAVTSPEAAAVFLEAWEAAGRPQVRVAVVGAGTGEVLLQAGCPVSFTPSQALGKVMGRELPHIPGGTDHVLYPASAKASTDLQDSLAASGFIVQRLNTYSTSSVSQVAPELLSAAAGAPIVTFGSPTAVKAWVGLVGLKVAQEKASVCIGSTSAKACASAGLTRVFHPSDPGIPGWVEQVLLAVHEQEQAHTTSIAMVGEAKCCKAFHNLLDVEELARAKLSAQAYNYYSSGSNAQSTLAANRAAFERVQLLPSVLRDVSSVDTSSCILGLNSSMPVWVAPMAMHGLAHREREAATVRGAAAAGVPFTQTVMQCSHPHPAQTFSTVATSSFEEVAAEQHPALIFQLYVVKDRTVVTQWVQQAEALGFRALMVTVDAPRLGRREADERDRFRLPRHLRLHNLELLSRGDEAQARQSKGGSGLSALFAGQMDAALTWDFIPWLRTITRLPIILKGILSPADAAQAIAVGVDGLVVSNHGGRQLDGTPPTLDVLPAVVAAVRGRVPVLMVRAALGGAGGRAGDGGIRRGSDVVKALALGASGVLLGRPVLYGLALGGAQGVTRVLQLLREELELAMALSGCAKLSDIGPGLLWRTYPLPCPPLTTGRCLCSCFSCSAAVEPPGQGPGTRACSSYTPRDPATCTRYKAGTNCQPGVSHTTRSFANPPAQRLISIVSHRQQCERPGGEAEVAHGGCAGAREVADGAASGRQRRTGAVEALSAASHQADTTRGGEQPANSGSFVYGARHLAVTVAARTAPGPTHPRAVRQSGEQLGAGRAALALQPEHVHDATVRDGDELLRPTQGYTLLLPRAVQGKLVEPDTFWARDLGGCHAFVKGSREYLGQVVDVFSGFGTYDTLLVQLALTAQDIQASRSRYGTWELASICERQCMVPFVKAMCPTVDLERRQIEMDLPEGLLDLAVTKRLDRPFTPEQVASRLAVLKSGRSPVWGQRMPEELQAALHVPAPSLAGTEQSDPAESARHTEVETEQVKQAAIVAPASAPKGGADRRSALRKSSMLRSRLPSRPAQQPTANGLRNSLSAASVSDGDEVEGEERGSDRSAATSPVSSDTREAASSERWKLRRKLGASLASKQRRPVR